MNARPRRTQLKISQLAFRLWILAILCFIAPPQLYADPPKALAPSNDQSNTAMGSSDVDSATSTSGEPDESDDSDEEDFEDDEEDFGAEDDFGDEEDGELSIEALMNIQVSSVAKSDHSLWNTAAAVTVIRGEAIRRSGALNIPEALRMVPGLHVSNVSSNTFAITIRGFGGRFSNKLLVMIDGRTVYTSIFSGVYWSHHMPLLANIDRIEIIRGPGSTLWGSNSVNGIIHIITKNSQETLGGLIQGTYGTEEKGRVAARYGGKINDTTSYRANISYFNRDTSHKLMAAGQADDKWDALHAGFRLDHKTDNNDELSLSAEIWNVNEDNSALVPITSAPFIGTVNDEGSANGFNFRISWQHDHQDGSQTTFKSYYDDTRRNEVIVEFREKILDFDIQHIRKFGDKLKLTAGVGYRSTRQNVTNNFTTVFADGDESLDLSSAFIQGEITLVPEKLTLTLGSKFEYNDFSHFEVQPSARIMWLATDKQSVWASVTRAVRTPARGTSDLLVRIPTGFDTPGTGLPIYTEFQGTHSFRSEDLVAFELGYRATPHKNFSVDVSAFLNFYDNLLSLRAQGMTVQTSPHLYISVDSIPSNSQEGRTYGVEVETQFAATEWWRITTAYSLIEHRIRLNTGNPADQAVSLSGGDPQHMAQFLSRMDIAKGVEFDTSAYYVDRLNDSRIPYYIRVDARLGWSPTENLKLSLVGKNLFDSKHEENSSLWVQGVELERAVYVMASWSF